MGSTTTSPMPTTLHRSSSSNIPSVSVLDGKESTTLSLIDELRKQLMSMTVAPPLQRLAFSTTTTPPREVSTSTPATYSTEVPAFNGQNYYEPIYQSGPSLPEQPKSSLDQNN